MKKTMFLLLFWVFVLPVLAFAELEWKKNVISYAAKPSDESVTALFHFANTGDHVVKILSTKTSCGCTVAQLEKDEYAPGELGTLKVKFTFGDRSGHHTKQIEIYTNDPAKPTYLLTLEVDIPEFLRVEPQILAWGMNTEPTPKSAVVEVLSKDPIVIKGAESQSENFSVELTTLEEGRRYRVSVTPKKLTDQMQSKLKLTTSAGEENPRLAWVILQVY